MIAQAWRVSSAPKGRGQDMDARTGSARLIAAQGMSVSKQGAIVQRHGNSRTTTYYTSRSAVETRKPKSSELQRVVRDERADVGSTASASSPLQGAGAVSPSAPFVPEKSMQTALVKDGSNIVSIDDSLQPSPCQLDKAAMQPVVQNTQERQHVHGWEGKERMQGMTDAAHNIIGQTGSSTSTTNMRAAVRVVEAPDGSQYTHGMDSEVLRDDGSSDAIGLAAFLCNRGFSGLQAERLALELHGENSELTSTSTLEQQMQRLESVLPGMDIRALIVKDSLVLSVDASAAARRLVFLSSNLGHPDLTQLIMTAPQLLYAQEVEERLEHCLDKLMSLLPEDYPLESLHKLLVEAPTIIFRMDYYVSASDLNDLPADLLHQLNGMRGGSNDTSCMI